MITIAGWTDKSSQIKRIQRWVSDSRPSGIQATTMTILLPSFPFFREAMEGPLVSGLQRTRKKWMRLTMALSPWKYWISLVCGFGEWVNLQHLAGLRTRRNVEEKGMTPSQSHPTRHMIYHSGMRGYILVWTKCVELPISVQRRKDPRTGRWWCLTESNKSGFDSPFYLQYLFELRNST